MPSFSSLKHTSPARELITLRKKGFLLLCVVLALIPAHVAGQKSGGGGEAHPALTTNPASLQRWKDMRFGMFIHWGSVIARYVKVRVSNVGVCPAWHTGAGGKAWLFVDELAIEK